MNVIKLIDRKFEEILLVSSIIVMILLIFFQVASRYIFNSSLAWSEELARYLFVWQVWLAVPYAVIKGRHIRLTLLRDGVGNTGKFVLDMIFFFISAGFFAYLGYQAVLLTQSIVKMNQLTPVLLIPKWICYLSLPVGCILGAFRFAQYGVKRAIRFSKDPANTETFVLEEGNK